MFTTIQDVKRFRTTTIYHWRWRFPWRVGLPDLAPPRRRDGERRPDESLKPLRMVPGKEENPRDCEGDGAETQI